MIAPLVSVVIPGFNPPESFLRECVQSLIAQTLVDWEAIFVDDGSTTGELAPVIASFRDRRLRTLRHDRNRGEGAARNTGIRAAHAEHIMYLDADDRLDPDCLEQAHRALVDHPEADWVLVDKQLFGAATDVLRWPVPLPGLCPAHFNAGSHGMFRRSVWERVGGYSEDPVFRAGGVDYDFWLSALERDARPVHVPRVLYWYRIHDMAASSTSLLYYRHRVHEAIYWRHRKLFDTFAGDCRQCRSEKRVPAFRSSAYVTSSQASLDRGERARAVALALRGLGLHPAGRNVRSQVLRALLPARLLSEPRR